MLHLGSSLKVCFLETILRDERDGIVGQVEIAESELDDRRYGEIRVREALQLLDLTGDGPVRMGIPSDVARSRRQVLSRKWSVAFQTTHKSWTELSIRRVSMVKTTWRSMVVPLGNSNYRARGPKACGRVARGAR